MSLEARRVESVPVPQAENDNSIPDAHREALARSLPMIKMWAQGGGYLDDIAMTLGNLEMKGITTENNELASALSKYGRALKASEDVEKLAPSLPDLAVMKEAARQGLATAEATLQGVVHRYEEQLGAQA